MCVCVGSSIFFPSSIDISAEIIKEPEFAFAPLVVVCFFLIIISFELILLLSFFFFLNAGAIVTMNQLILRFGSNFMVS